MRRIDACLTGKVNVLLCRPLLLIVRRNEKLTAGQDALLLGQLRLLASLRGHRREEVGGELAIGDRRLLALLRRASAETKNQSVQLMLLRCAPA